MSYLTAISHHFPKTIINNEDIIDNYYRFGGKKEVKVSSDLIFQQCGIRRRYRSDYKDTAKDLGIRAAEKLFSDWKIDRHMIDYLIFVSDALEYKGPTTACVLQEDLKLSNHIGAIDILHGCTGWVYGKSVAKALIIAGQAQNVLLITADVPTKVIHPEDLELSSIFSDAGAASLICQEPMEGGLNYKLGEFTFGTDGKGEKNLWVERSGTREPSDIKWLKQYENLPTGLVGGRLRMNSPKIFLFTLRKVPLLVDAILEKHQLKVDDIDYFIFHQANGTMLEFIRKRMKIPKEKFIIDIEYTGNTVSASIPIALDRVQPKKNIKENSRILIAGFGIGYSWGGTVLTT